MPYNEAYPELNDLAELFDNKGAHWNPYVIKMKDEISARITNKQIKLLKLRQEGKGSKNQKIMGMNDMLARMLI